MMFGYAPVSLDDKIIRLAEENIQLGTPLFKFDRCWVGFLPFLRHVPHWMPGATSQKIAKRCRDMSEELMSIPMAHVQKAMVSVLTTFFDIDIINSLPSQSEGNAYPSLVTDYLEKKATVGATAEEGQIVNNVAWTVYTGMSASIMLITIY